MNDYYNFYVDNVVFRITKQTLLNHPNFLLTKIITQNETSQYVVPYDAITTHQYVIDRDANSMSIIFSNLRGYYIDVESIRSEELKNKVCEDMGIFCMFGPDVNLENIDDDILQTGDENTSLPIQEQFRSNDKDPMWLVEGGLKSVDEGTMASISTNKYLIDEIKKINVEQNNNDTSDDDISNDNECYENEDVVINMPFVSLNEHLYKIGGELESSENLEEYILNNYKFHNEDSDSEDDSDEDDKERSFE